MPAMFSRTISEGWQAVNAITQLSATKGGLIAFAPAGILDRIVVRPESELRVYIFSSKPASLKLVDPYLFLYIPQ